MLKCTEVVIQLFVSALRCPWLCIENKDETLNVPKQRKQSPDCDRGKLLSARQLRLNSHLDNK